MATTKLKAGIVTAIIVVSVVTPVFVQFQARARLREQDNLWQRRSEQLAQVTADNQRLADLLGQTKNTRPPSDKDLAEVLRLRNEVGLLRRNIQEMTSAKTTQPQSRRNKLESMKKKYAGQVERLKQWLEAHPAEKIPELQNLPEAIWIDDVNTLTNNNNFARAASLLRINAENHQVFSTLTFALRKYAQDNSRQFPRTFPN